MQRNTKSPKGHHLLIARRSREEKENMRRAQDVVSHPLLRRSFLASSPAGASSSAAFSFAPAAGTVGDHAKRSRWRRLPPPPCPARLKSVSAGIAGAISFSLALASVTAAEAKESPPASLMPKEVVLYQYEACPFCNKVRSFLDYNNIPYKVVEVNPLSKKEIKWSDYKKVPILVVDGEKLIESSDIINRLNHKLYPDTATDEEEEKWLKWVDNHLVHVLSPNIYRTTSEALESFDYIAKNGNFSTTERFTVKYAGAAIMYIVSKKLKKKYNITDERAALYEAAQTWTEALNGRDFLGGSRPSLADLAVFGVLRPIRYLRSGKDMVENTGIGEWYQKMETVVGDSTGLAN